MAKAKAKSNFDKFINKPVKGAKIKEAIRQEKKAAVRERRDAIEQHFEEKRRLKAEKFATQGTNENQSTKGAGKKFGPKNAKEEAWKKKNEEKAATSGKSFSAADKKPEGRGGKDFKKPYEKKGPEGRAGSKGTKKPYDKAASEKRINQAASGKKSFAPKPTDRPVKPPYGLKENNDRPAKAASTFKENRERSASRPAATNDGDNAKPPHKRPFEKKPLVARGPQSIKKNTIPKPTDKGVDYTNELTPAELAMSDYDGNEPDFANAPKKVKAAAEAKPRKTAEKPAQKKTAGPKVLAEKEADKTPVIHDMPLNKFLAHAGVCSRRDAADLVRKGGVTVDGVTITEPAFKVTDDAVVKLDGKSLQRTKNLVYILMNKPKDYITTNEDPQGRKTVMDIIKHATTERVYPIGRLDRNTSGVLLFTNDGDMAQKLSHPSFEVRKIYEVRLDKVLQKDDFEKILNGVKLEDGEVHADSLAYGDKDKNIVGIEIHSGKNRVVRRIFESLGYDVRGLDRVMYANLTKKNVERGKWRFLDDKEIRLLKYFNKSKQK